MRRSTRSARARAAFPRLARLLAILALATTLAACGGRKIAFHYPGEEIDFTGAGPVPSVHVGLIRDLRPEVQHRGAGHFLRITYPSDRAWEWPVTQIYREALEQDLAGTHLVELVPLPSQADYTLEADVLSLTSRLSRSPASFLMPLALGGGAGIAFGEDASDRVKLGAVVGIAALMALPLPTPHRAEAEIRLLLRDRDGEVVWERTCLGAVDDNVYVSATSRNDQKLVDDHLTRAVKRADACLLGQLRQALAGGLGEESAP